MNDFLRTYKKQDVTHFNIAEEDIEKAFLELEKHTQEERTHNCYACGSYTCREMAERISKGINIPENCIEKNRHKIIREHQAFINEKSNNLAQINEINQEISEVKRLYGDVLDGISKIEQAMVQYSEMAKEVTNMAMQTNLLSVNAPRSRRPGRAPRAKASASWRRPYGSLRNNHRNPWRRSLPPVPGQGRLWIISMTPAAKWMIRFCACRII